MTFVFRKVLSLTLSFFYGATTKNITIYAKVITDDIEVNTVNYKFIKF